MGKRQRDGMNKQNKGKKGNDKKFKGGKKPRKFNKEKPVEQKSPDVEGNFVEEEEGSGNKADFYLDDADADIAEDEKDESEMSLSDSEAEGGSELDFGEEDYIPSEDEEEKEEEKVKKEKKITKVELKRILKKCGEGSPIAITKMIILFAKLTSSGYKSSLDEDDILNNPKVVTNLIKFCIKNLPEILLLKLHSINSAGVKENTISEKASVIKGLIKRYLSALCKYLKTTENSMISLVYKYMDTISELFMGYKNFIEVFLKLSTKIWATRHGTPTAASAYRLIKGVLQKKPEYFENTLKLFYVSYLDIAKAMNWHSIAKINQMQNEIIGILSLDLQKAYITIFTFVRKLSLQLRLTITDKKAASIKNIYNWQFINAIKLWAKVVVKYYHRKNCEINLLAYPLIQTILGVLRLNLVDSFYPLRIILVRLLNEISYATDIYIPVTTYLVEILESSHFKSKFKEKHLTEEKGLLPDVNINLKVGKKESFKHYGFVNYLLEEIIDTLNEYLAINSFKYSFPEIAFGVCYNLKKIQKSILDKNFRDSLKSFIEKVNAHSNLISMRRMGLILLDLDKIKNFEEEMKTDKSNEMISLIEKIKHKREATIESRLVQSEDKFIEI